MLDVGVMVTMVLRLLSARLSSWTSHLGMGSLYPLVKKKEKRGGGRSGYRVFLSAHCYRNFLSGRGCWGIGSMSAATGMD